MAKVRGLKRWTAKHSAEHHAMAKAGNGVKRGRGRPPKAESEKARQRMHDAKIAALDRLLSLPAAERAMVIGAVQALTK